LIAVVVIITFGWFTNWQFEFADQIATPNQKASTENQISQWSIKPITTKVTSKANNRFFSAIGDARAQLSIDLYPSVAADVLEVNFTAGEKVEKSDVLVTLDNLKEQLAVELATIQFNEQRRVFNELAKASKNNAIPQTNVAAARANKDQARVKLLQAQEALADRTIRAPFAGIIGLPLVDPGDRVTPTTKIASLDDRSLIFVDFRLPESLTSELYRARKKGERLVLTSSALPQNQFDAEIASTESRLEQTSRTLLVRLRFENDQDLVRPGMAMKVNWHIQGQPAQTVPEIALQWSSEGPYIWIVRQQQVEKTPVTIIARQEGQVLLQGEFKVGEEVVVEGVQRMRQGLRVNSQLRNSLRQ